MSGYKRATVTISEEEYRRLHQADMKRRLQGHTRSKAKGKKTEQTAELTNALQEMENRQQQLEQALSELGHGLNRAQSEAVQDVLRQNARQYEQLTAMLEETASDAHTSIADTSQRFAEEMQQAREQHRRDIHALMSQLETYEGRDRAKAEAARHWLRQSVAIADFIREQFDHERFAPGRLSVILARLDFAQNNLASGFSESSLQASQQAFLELSDLHFELEQRLVEWQTEYRKAYDALDQFVDELQLNSRVNAFGLDGEELPEQVDVAYWSSGQYAQLMEKSRQLLRLLSQDRQNIPTEELTRTHRELIPVIRERFESIVYEARMRVLNSQLRMNIAERALQALEVHGFTLNEAGYVGEDMRAPFTAQLGSSDGSRVTIQVVPAEQTSRELTNELVVITNHPYLKTEQEARLQWDELSRSLSQFDLQVSRPTVSAAPPLITPEQHETAVTHNQQPAASKRFHNVR